MGGCTCCLSCPLPAGPPVAPALHPGLAAPLPACCAGTRTLHWGSQYGEEPRSQPPGSLSGLERADPLRADRGTSHLRSRRQRPGQGAGRPPGCVSGGGSPFLVGLGGGQTVPAPQLPRAPPPPSPSCLLSPGCPGLVSTRESWGLSTHLPWPRPPPCPGALCPPWL